MMRAGVRLGIDVGKVRVGVARSDRDGLLAVPLETVKRAGSSGTDLARICALAHEYQAIEVVVGLPLGLHGRRTPATDDARQFAADIAQLLAAKQCAIPVRLVDERFSTVSAHTQLRQVGRNVKQSRGVVDQVAAVIILQHALDLERARDVAPGTLLDNDVVTGDQQP